MEEEHQKILDEWEERGLDPSDDMPEELKKVATERARAWAEDPIVQDRELNLMEDQIKVPQQNFVLMSIIGPECTQRSDKMMLKIYGCFNTNEEAQAHAKRVQKSQNEEDVQFHVLMGGMYKWLPIPPQVEKIGEQYYDDEWLNDMMIKYKENQQASKELFNIRKDLLMKNKSVNITTLGEEQKASEILEGIEEDVPLPSAEAAEANEAAAVVKEVIKEAVEEIAEAAEAAEAAEVVPLKEADEAAEATVRV